MPRRAKGPRFWLRPARYDTAGKLTHEPAWLILDGTKQHATRLGIGASEREKDEALKVYLAQKTAPTVGSRDPSQIDVNDVLAKYVTDKDPPYETLLRIKALRKFWGDKKLSEVIGDTCREYAATRTAGAARRELEDFRAAINHHRREGLHDRIVSVVLPEKSRPKEDYLERGEAAALIWHAWRYREQQNLRATDRATRKHVARFMVVARYMGSRAGVICEASLEPRRPNDRAWVNLKTGMFYALPPGQAQSKKRRQLVRVPGPLLAHLRRWQARGQRYVVEWNGEPVAKVRKAHDAAVAACQGVLGRHVSPHIWRHTVATWLMQGGGEPFKIAGFLAMSVETLVRVYGHHHPDHSADVHETIRKKRRAA
ncbi:site-specific integrase [Bradyrhizobium sp. HKCCYLS2038]|uniref:site-specific integrase n=1 Tax=Bradyrhizobium sp. HKCCYLS2038 TaxID=3420764 RepID=UPI003EB6D704